MKNFVRTCVIVFALGVVALPALATDSTQPQRILPDPGSKKKAVAKEPFVHKPANCDFQITFPEAPMRARRCPDGQGPGKQCYDLTSYTMVYDLHTTVDISVTCNPSTGTDNFKRYSEPVMRAALEGMITRRGIENYNIGFQEYETVRSATLTGSGRSGRQEKIYTAQIWVGPTSVFTLQAELVGGAHPQADAMFRDVLKSLEVQGAAEEDAPAPSDDEKSDEKKED